MWQRATAKLVEVEYGACEFVKPDPQAGLWVLDSDFPNTCATQLQRKTAAALVFAGGVVVYEGVTLLPPMVRRRSRERHLGHFRPFLGRSSDISLR